MEFVFGFNRCLIEQIKNDIDINALRDISS